MASIEDVEAQDRIHSMPFSSRRDVRWHPRRLFLKDGACNGEHRYRLVIFISVLAIGLATVAVVNTATSSASDDPLRGHRDLEYRYLENLTLANQRLLDELEELIQEVWPTTSLPSSTRPPRSSRRPRRRRPREIVSPLNSGCIARICFSDHPFRLDVQGVCRRIRDDGKGS